MPGYSTLPAAMESLLSALGEGTEAAHLTVLQVLARAVIMFFATLCIVRVADKRFFAKKTAFDLILGFILASMMARAINGSEKVVSTVVAGFALAVLHRGLGWAACRWPQSAGWFKGHSETLVRDGVTDVACMRRHHVSDDDLLEALRLKGVEDPSQAKLARLERSGEISVVRKEQG